MCVLTEKLQDVVTGCLEPLSWEEPRLPKKQPAGVTGLIRESADQKGAGFEAHKPRA